MSIKEPAPVSPAKFVRLKGVTGTGHFVHAITFVTRKPDPFSKCKCGITVMAGFEGGGNYRSQRCRSDAVLQRVVGKRAGGAIFRLRVRENWMVRQIAAVTGRSASIISRELRCYL